MSPRHHWWLVNAAAHRRMVESAGFRIERSSRLYSVPFGEGHPGRVGRQLPSLIWRRVLTGNDGNPHSAVLARPDF